MSAPNAPYAPPIPRTRGVSMAVSRKSKLRQLHLGTKMRVDENAENNAND